MAVENLTAYERETHLLMNDEDPIVTICSAQRAEIRRMRLNKNFREKSAVMYGTTEVVWFEIDRNMYSVAGGVRHKKSFSEAQKMAATARLAKVGN